MYKKNLEGATLQGFILLENLFKPRQLLRKSLQTTSASICNLKTGRLTVGMVTDSFENLFKPRQLPSATSKQCFEQPAASLLVCSLIFIEL
ncbi:hypothetical protein [Streptococcus pneumoniae]|uniref:hypothetical protein n=1 Tax=Streptococcus pneumoniae TaxID=1313 RepID=UPI0015D988B0|nr:hypothetical protein [Streptococcus pneumoniae]